MRGLYSPIPFGLYVVALLSREQCVGTSARVDALCSSCSLQKYLER